MNNRATLTLICAMIVITACIFVVPVAYLGYQNAPSIKLQQEKISIEQIMEHRPGFYSIKTKAVNNELIENCISGDVKIIADVPDNEQIWALLDRCETRRGEIIFVSGTIHIHGAREINGGGWDYGELGRGQTVVIDSN